MEQVAAQENLRRALAAVKRNHGAAGIDGRTTGQLASHLARHGEKIRAKLLAGRWTPSPLRRVAIPKPHGGKRLLGIPTVIERLLQPALLQVLTPIFEPLCSEPGYGFRPGRSAHGDSELDRETSATASERGEERGGAALGTEVPGVSHQPPGAARSGAAKCRAAQAEGARDLAQLPQCDEPAVTRRVAAVYRRLVGL